MAGKIIDGPSLAKTIQESIRERVSKRLAEDRRQPGLTVVLVGEDPASEAYVRGKERSCSRVGILSTTVRLPVSSSEDEVLGEVARLNNDPEVHGILVQLPLPAHMNVEKVVAAISPLKDVDAFHPENLGLLFRDTPRFIPCTPAGIMDVLGQTGITLEGLHAVVIGRSLIVGKPLSLLLLKEHMTVTVCHSRTRNLPDLIRSADVIVAAVGRLRFVKGDWVKPGAIVIDVGMNVDEEGKLAGDVEFDSALLRASFITPVPGGVGRLTVARLLSNVLAACELQELE
jgi:methylenetetrahydrofolate dehydrogenase (NADP+) / methenyltetrahydrofolate cyclohydrolase